MGRPPARASIQDRGGSCRRAALTASTTGGQAPPSFFRLLRAFRAQGGARGGVRRPRPRLLPSAAVGAAGRGRWGGV